MKFLSQINVNTEYTLPIVDGTNGQVLTTDGNGAVYWSSSAGAANLNALTDVELTSPSTGQILRYEIPLGGSVPVWRNVTPAYLDPNSSINALGDVVITSATSGQILQFNGTYWINTTLSTVEYVSKVQHTVKAGVAITKGQAVYVTGADGTNMIVGLASNASEATSSKVIGLAASNASTNDQIFVVTEGLLAGLNTSTATAGDPVWLGTNGNLIFGLLNKPVAPAHLVYIGVVTRVQQNNGEIFVNVQNGFELNEIHDALIVSPTAGQLLRRDSDNLWKNWTPNYLTAHPTIANGGSVNNSNGTVIQDITLETNGHVTAITSVDLDSRYYTESEIIAFFGGELEIAGYNQTNWDTAYNNTVTGVSFSTSTGVLTLTQQDTGTLTVDLDGRYIESETDTLASVTGRGNVTSTPIRVEAAATGLGGYISVGNSTEVAGNYSAYFFGNTAGDASYFKGGIAYETIASTYGRGNIHFLQNTSTSSGIVTLSDSVMTILNNGNVGIGTTSPSTRLEVLGDTEVITIRTSYPANLSQRGGLLWKDATNITGAIDTRYDGTTVDMYFGSLYNSGYNSTTRMVIKGNGNVGIGRTSPSYKIDVAGNARFDNELYVGGVWSSSYGPRTAGGNIHFHDWSGNVRARINTVAGVTSVGNRKLSLGILDINSQGTPEIKINTKIPFALGGADFTVNIKGFQYGSSNMVSLSIGWHYYLSQFYNETAISNGSFSPTITLGVEPEGDYAGCVVIHLSNVGYWPKLYVESVYSSAYADDYIANWSWSDVGIDGLTSTSVVAYKPLETSITGNAAYATNAGNSTTTSQTNFTTLTLSNATVATQTWVQAQGYATSFSETDTLATVTARGATTSTPITVTASEGREVAVYMPSSYTTDDLVSGHEYGWYSDHWRLGITRSGGAAGADFVVQWNGARRLSLTNGGNLTATGVIYATGGNSTNWNAAYGWGNHADAPYWNVSLTDAVQVEAQEVIFAGNVTIQGTLTESSSIRFKENIAPLEPSLDKVNQLEAVSYNKIGADDREIGLIAEDVAGLFPEVVTYNEEGRPQGIQYQRLSVILLKAVQELTERVNKLENK